MLPLPRPYIFATTTPETDLSRAVRRAHGRISQLCHTLHELTTSVAEYCDLCTSETEDLYRRAIKACYTYLRLLLVRRNQLVGAERRAEIKGAHFDFYSWYLIGSYYQQTGRHHDVRGSTVNILDEWAMAGVLYATLCYNHSIVVAWVDPDYSCRDQLVNAISVLRPMIHLQHRRVGYREAIYVEIGTRIMLSVYHRIMLRLQMHLEHQSPDGELTISQRIRAMWCATLHGLKSICLMRTALVSWSGNRDLVRATLDMCRTLVGISREIATVAQEEGYREFRTRINADNYDFIVVTKPNYDMRQVVNITHYELYIHHLCFYLIQSQPDVPNIKDLSEAIKNDCIECEKFLVQQETLHSKKPILLYDPSKAEDAMRFMKQLQPLPLYTQILQSTPSYFGQMIPKRGGGGGG